MKRIFPTLILLVCLSDIVTAQVKGINFQAVARNSAGGVVANKKITVRLTIRDGSPQGITEYSETKSTVTNVAGLFSIVLGEPEPTAVITGVFDNIFWRTGNKYLQVEIDADGGTNFVSAGVQKINFVPYAHFANSVAATSIAGVVPVDKGGTGATSLGVLKTILSLDKADNTRDMDKPVSNPMRDSLSLKINKSESGIANGLATLDATGKIPNSQLPSILLHSVSVVDGQTQMLALPNAAVGTVAIRTDINKNFVLAELPASELNNWKELLAPVAPVQSVNGKTGNISLTKADLLLGNVDNTGDFEKPVSVAVKAQLDTRESLENKTLDIITDSMSDIKYPSAKAVKKFVESQAPQPYSLPVASALVLGGIKVGNNLSIDANGVLNGTDPAQKAQSDWAEADNTKAGYIKNKPVIFSGSYMDLTNKPTLFSGNYNDLTNKPAAYSLPVATASVLGGIKLGNNLSIDANGVVSATGTGLGSVTSVGLAMPDIFSVAGTPVTSTGTITATLLNQNANLVWAGPVTGTAAPAFRALTASDIPLLNQNTTGTASNVTGIVAIANGGTGSATQNFVDLSTTQTVAGAKTFSSNLTANGFVKTGGTSAQFLKADGSVDASTYLSSADISNKLNVSDTAAMLANLLRKTDTSFMLSPYRRSTTLITNSDMESLNYSKLTGTVPVWNQNTTGTAANVTGIIAIANGGTGSTSASDAIQALLPAQTGNNGKFLKTDGTTASWQSAPTGLTIPISGAEGGTGVDNTGKTITLGGNLTTSGAFPTTITSTAATNVTLPVSGELSTVAGAENLTNKTLSSPNITGTATINNQVVNGTITLPALSAGFVQLNAAGLLGSASLTSSNVTTALGYIPVHPMYAQFSDNTTQTNTLLTAKAMTLNTTDISSSYISVVEGAKIKVTVAGVYNVMFSAQISKSNAGTDYCTIWFRKNGVDIPNSATDFSLTGAGSLEVAAWNYMSSLAANDYLEIMWSIEDINISILAIAARTGPTRPAVPSLIVTVNRVD
ncbi:MAG: hypothetical protein PHD73_07055 [Sediminibacterium sp.]|nr:hypothetical protein [Sediminibacterium sp.]